eukprot:15081906-Ditylum_brightwellii.AAC.1
MIKTERGSIKISPSRFTRDVTVWENVSKEKRKKKFCNYHEPQKAHSANAPYHRTAEALAGPVCQGHQKAGQKAQPDRQR